MSKYKSNHYVPQWYQKSFISEAQENKQLFYLNLKPETKVSEGHEFKTKDLYRWGPISCFCEDDLYTTQLSGWESTEIEREFFGKIDTDGSAAVRFFAQFNHGKWDNDAWLNFLKYMSIQKLRTPKGLQSLSKQVNFSEKDKVLLKMKELKDIFCATWADCIWSIADASESETKFIFSDHPVSIYNPNCPPDSAYCQDCNDPDIRFIGSHTLFPLTLDKILILTNLSWVRNPYGDSLEYKPNLAYFRSGIFDRRKIQIGRILLDNEVKKINYIIKKRAHKYIAAMNKEWLYPEDSLQNEEWNKIADDFMLMPDPREIRFTGRIIVSGTRPFQMDEYGRVAGEQGFDSSEERQKELKSFHRFEEEFISIVGDAHRGKSKNI